MPWTCTGLDMMDEQDLPCSAVPGLVTLPAKGGDGLESLHVLLPARVAAVVAAGIFCQTLPVAAESRVALVRDSGGMLTADACCPANEAEEYHGEV